MDPPPPPAAATLLSYPESIDSSPRSRNADSWDDPLPSSQKLRFMCSYGGHIVPRPHDRSLCYLGGDTRIMVVDRSSSLADLSARLSRTLLSGRSFTLKYQLPNEDLDSLISVTTDEDLENMIEEYDRTSSASGSSLKPSRLRLFLFPTKVESLVESVSSMGSLLDDSKSENWFVDALNGSGILPREYSADAATVNCLLGLDGDVERGGGGEIDKQHDASLGNNIKYVKSNQDVHSVPDSPMLDTHSSFGSTSSSPNMSNLPPIRVHVDDQRVGLDEQFAQLNVSAALGAGGGGGGVVVVGQKQDEGFGLLASPPPLPTTIAVVTGIPAGGFVENPNRVMSDDERSERSERSDRSEQGVAGGFRKPPQPLPPQLVQKVGGGGIDLPSPDGGLRDNNIQDAIPRSKPMYYQEPIVQVAPRDGRVQDVKRELPSPNYPGQQIPDSGYVLASQLDQLQLQQQQQLHQHQQQQQQQLQQQQQQQQLQQQQFINAGTHYIPQQPTGHMPPMSSYYQMHPQQQQHPHQQLDPHYPMYYVTVPQNQAYSYPLQSNISETTGIPSSRPPIPPNPSMLPTPAAYKEQPAAVFPSRAAPPPKPELAAANMYRTAATPQLVQVPADPQYVSYSPHQMHHASQSIAAPATTANYGYEFSDPTSGQMYYTQPMGTTLPPQYQTMTTAAAVAASEASTQLPADTTKPQMRTPQPI